MQLISRDRILDLAGTDKRSVLDELVRSVATVPGQLPPAQLLQAILDREELRSTGLGEMIAIPHCKDPRVKSFGLALGRSKKPIEFGSPDNVPVRVLAMISAPSTRQTEYLRLLSAVTRFLKKERDNFLNATDVRTIHDVLGSY